MSQRDVCTEANSWRISECCLEEEGKFHRKVIFKDQKRKYPS